MTDTVKESGEKPVNSFLSRIQEKIEISDTAIIAFLAGLFGGATLLSFGFWVAQFLSSPLPEASGKWPDFFGWINGFLQNAGTEFLGALLTFYLIETLLRKRRQQETKDIEATAEKERLILQMGSPDNGFAVEAARQLKARGWLDDGSLEGAVLREANLQGAVLYKAKLQGAELLGAKLQGANLRIANLQGANLRIVNLQGADLQGANLEEADLSYANLEEADLQGANLEGAVLYKTNLQGATLSYANLQGATLVRANLQGATLVRANLEGARLEYANLKRANLTLANLEGALYLTVEQLRSARTLERATLPDGTVLSDDDTWQQAFERWVEHTVQFKEIAIRPLYLKGTYIVPTRTEANAKLWDEYYGDGE